MAMKPVDREPIVIRSVSPRTPVLRNSDTPRYSVRFDPIRYDSTRLNAAYRFFSRTDSTDSQDCLPIFLSMLPVFYFFFFSTFCSFGFRAVD